MHLTDNLLQTFVGRTFEIHNYGENNTRLRCRLKSIRLQQGKIYWEFSPVYQADKNKRWVQVLDCYQCEIVLADYYSAVTADKELFALMAKNGSCTMYILPATINIPESESAANIGHPPALT